MSSNNRKLCVPGDRLALAKQYVAGPGTFERFGYIYSRLAGELIVEEKDGQIENEKVKQVSVISPRTPSILPKTGDIVTAKVTIVNSRTVQCIIKCVGPTLLARSYKGVLKKEDIRATEKDRVDPYKCFRPGDVILARVLPMTEVHWYHLSTAENELGVAIATAEGAPQGVNMVPTSWTEMQCPKTLVKEPRKVARILPENLDPALMPHNIDIRQMVNSNSG